MTKEENENRKLNLFRIPSISTLVAFERAATSSSFVKAAEEIGRSPSMVSRSISELEEKLGSVLFMRVGKSVQLTEAGRKYLIEVRAALNILDRASSPAENVFDNNTVRLHVAPLFANAVLIPRLPEFKKQFPDLEIVLVIDRKGLDWSLGDMDVEIKLGETGDERLQSIKLGSVYNVPVCTPEIAYELNDIPDLQKHVLIHYNPHEWRAWLSSMGYPDLSIKQELELRDFLAIYQAVREGLGVGLAPYPFVNRYPCYGTEMVLPFQDKPLDDLMIKRSEYHLVCHKDRVREHKIALFRDWLMTTYENMVDGNADCELSLQENNI